MDFFPEELRFEPFVREGKGYVCRMDWSSAIFGGLFLTLQVCPNQEINASRLSNFNRHETGSDFDPLETETVPAGQARCWLYGNKTALAFRNN